MRKLGDLLPGKGLTHHAVHFERTGEEIRSVSEGEPMGTFTVTAVGPGVRFVVQEPDEEDRDLHDGKWLW